MDGEDHTRPRSPVRRGSLHRVLSRIAGAALDNVVALAVVAVATGAGAATVRAAAAHLQLLLWILVGVFAAAVVAVAAAFAKGIRDRLRVVNEQSVASHQR